MATVGPVSSPGTSSESPVKIKVGIVDDDPLVRSALGLMLGGQADIEVVGEATDGQEALALVRTSAPDVVLMDIRMPRINGLEATRRVLTESRSPRVIVLTTFGADEYVVDALAAGADGFLLKDTPPPEIVAAIRAVASGEPILSPKATRTLITRLRAEPTGERAAAASRRLEALT
jgi:DNA-binding NarL/FixJ family response regulator